MNYLQKKLYVWTVLKNNQWLVTMPWVHNYWSGVTWTWRFIIPSSRFFCVSHFSSKNKKLINNNNDNSAVLLPGSALHGLSVKNLNRSPSTRMNLVIHHMLQTLVISGANENLWCDFSASESIVQDLKQILKHRLKNTKQVQRMYVHIFYYCILIKSQNTQN